MKPPVFNNLKTIIQDLPLAFVFLIIAFGVTANFQGLLLHPILLGLVCSGILVIINKSLPKYSSWPGIILLSIYSIFTLYWAARYHSVQLSDFGVYYHCGSIDIHQAVSISNWISQCQSHYMSQNSLFWTRSLLYTVPIGAAFPHNYTALKFINAFLHIATLIIFYTGLTRIYHPRFACMATFLLAIYPEWWFTITLATSDNIALLAVISFFFCAYRFFNKPHFFLLLLMGILILANDLIRTIGIMLIITMLLTPLIIPEWAFKKRMRFFAAALIIILIYTLLWQGITLFTGPSTAMDPSIIKNLSSLDISSLQDGALNYSWAEFFWQAMPLNLRNHIGLSKFLLEISHHLPSYFSYLWGKSKIFFSGIGYYFFSSASIGYNPDTVNVVSTSNIPTSIIIRPIITVYMFFLLLLSLLGLMRKDKNTLAIIMIIYTFVFLGIIVGLGEAQARYSLLIAPVLAFFAAQGLDTFRSLQLFTLPKIQGFFSIMAALILGAGLFYSLVLWAHGSTVLAPYSFANFKKDNPDSPAVKTKINYKHISVQFPVFPMDFKHTVCFSGVFPKRSKALSFFVTSDYYPYLFEKKIRSPFRYHIIINNHRLINDALNSHSVKFYNLIIPLIQKPTVNMTWCVTPVRRVTADNNKITLTLLLKSPS